MPGESEQVKKLWAAGFSESFKERLDSGLDQGLKVETELFPDGEEVLVSLTRALSRDQAPDLLVLELRLPIINGINVAIAIRAFELGYSRTERIPIVFFFDPPASSSFHKVVKFCQPLTVIAPGHSQDSIREAIEQLALELRRL